MLLTMACQDNLFYSNYKTIQEKGWGGQDTLTYIIPEVEDTTKLNVNIGIRVWHNYQYTNLVLVAKLYEDNKCLSSDIVDFSLYDKADMSTGSGFPLVEYQEELEHKYTLKPSHKYTVKIAHRMLLDPLPRVSNVGISLNK